MVGIKEHRTVLWFTFILFSAILITIGGCGKSGNIGFVVETDYLIDTMWADYPVLVSGGQTDIYARVVGANSGEPLRDVIVNFSTDIDTIENVQVITNNDGIAVTTFITYPDSTRRTATITGKVTAEQIRTKRLYIDLLPINFTDPVYIFLTATPDTVYADGVSRIDLEARVLDETYSPLEGHQVHFSFVEGDSGDLILEVDSFAVTGADGKATAHFTAPNTSRLIVMDATVYGVHDTVSARDSIWVLDIPDVDFIDLRADPSSIPADGTSELTLSAYTTVGATGTPAPDGTQITFTSDDGTLLPYTSKGKGTLSATASKGRFAPIRRISAGSFRERPASTRIAETVVSPAMAGCLPSTVAWATPRRRAARTSGRPRRGSAVFVHPSPRRR